LTITPTFAKTTGPVTGPAYTLLKDLTAPAAPTADLASGSYFAPRSVTLAAGPLEPVTVHYALGAAALPAPTATSPVATGPIALSPTGAPQTLSAVSVDRAGNPSSPVAAWTYTVNPATAPDAPTGVRVLASGDGSATLVWDVPAANGSPITDYVVRAYAAGATLPSSVVQATSTSVVVPNLSNGTAYTFEVAARNAVGTGLYSARNASATPLALPSAPTISTARADDGSASVSWTPTANSGGSPVTSYVVRAYLAGSSSWVSEVNAGAGDSRTTVTGLTNGTAYDFAVRAVTDVGAGAWSGRSNSVTPTAPRVAPAVTAPGAPLIGRPVRGNASATVSWEPPATTGGSPITGYLVQAYEAGSLTRTVSVGASSFRATVPALRNGRAYTFRARALNGVGPGQLSAESVSVVPATVASAPGVGKAAAGKARGPVTATAKWTAPKSNGGSAVTAYQVVAEKLNAKGRVVRTTTSPRLSAKSRAHAMKLPPGKYRFRIAAFNSVGRSSLSARSNTVMAR
ncbi:MAG: large repetitive protein, partial [Actinomycetota bacterium]|nr:large repetitive protein [Actinomycetota bacterium]